MKMNIKKTALAGAIVTIASVGFTNVANATAYATAVLSNTDVKLTLGDGTDGGEGIGTLGRNLTVGDFATLVANNTGAITATLNATTATDSDLQNLFGPVNGDINLTNQWVGVNTVGDDNYAAIAPPPTSTYANGDSDLAGSIIDVPAAGITAGASAETRADVSLTNLGDGNTQSNLALSATSVFTAGSALTAGFTLSFDYLAYLAVQLTADEIIPGSVNANLSWKVQLRHQDGSNLQTFEPGELNLLSSFDAPFNGTDIQGGSGQKAWFTGALIQDQVYVLTIQHDTNASATSAVPEPSTIALLGVALLGVGVSSRKRLNK